MASISFDNSQIAPFDFFVGRKPMLASETLTTPANRSAGLRRTRVDNLILKVSAFWASHG
jgi:hypothetical protein